MSVKFNTKKVLELFKERGGKTSFSDSLRDVLEFAQDDDNITNANQLAYLLATAKVEADYSLTRWEADYLCNSVGVAYKGKPCQRAIDYYKSTNGKKNYFTLGTDKNGMAYFGRGLIQLTGKSNYDFYGKKIGVDLVGDGDKAIIPKNSYKIASAYLTNRTWKHLANNDLTKARSSVNGGTRGLSDVNNTYKFWQSIFKNPSVKFKEGGGMSSKTKRAITITAITLSLVAIGISAYFVYRKKLFQ